MSQHGADCPLLALDSPAEKFNSRPVVPLRILFAASRKTSDLARSKVAPCPPPTHPGFGDCRSVAHWDSIKAIGALRMDSGNPAQAAITRCRSASNDARKRQSGPPECSARVLAFVATAVAL